MLHDRLYVEVVGQLPNRAQRQAAAAGLVAREARFVDEEDASPRSRKAVRGSRAGGPGTDDYRVETLHGPNPRRNISGVKHQGKMAWITTSATVGSAKASVRHRSTTIFR
jgi:hypothetical protein